MSEPFSEQVLRVRLMTTTPDAWDLSPNDIAALKAVLARCGQLESVASVARGFCLCSETCDPAQCACASNMRDALAALEEQR
jgi:hypothetical protein